MEIQEELEQLRILESNVDSNSTLKEKGNQPNPTSIIAVNDLPFYLGPFSYENLQENLENSFLKPKNHFEFDILGRAKRFLSSPADLPKYMVT